jgi:hypothetical protein
MTTISKELQDALDAAEDQCLKAVSHVGQHNSNGRESDARQWVLEAFNVLTDEIKMEPHRADLTEWRKAVADGKTTLGYEAWKKGERG